MVKILRRSPQYCSIEELPDEVLGDIVSRLKTNDAARLCSVSKRWSRVWAFSSQKNLNFDFTDIKNCDKHVIDRIYIGMNKHQQTLVDKLRIAYHHHRGPLNNVIHAAEFFEWFNFSNHKNVQSLVMDIKAPIAIPGSMPDLIYNLIQPSALHDLEIAIPALHKLGSWDRLTTVSLKSAIMLDKDVNMFLSKVPNLETLLLDNVPFKNLEVKDTNPKLKRLEIVHCAVLKGIHIISAPNLKCFKHVPLMNKSYKSLKVLPIKMKRKPYANDYLIETNVNLRFEHATTLRDIYLGGPLCRNLLLEIQKYAPQLQKLQLNIDLKCDHEECWKPIRTIPTFENLKQLQLAFISTGQHCCDYRKMSTIINIIHSCPSLEKLTLKYEIQKADMDLDDDNLGYTDRGPNEFLNEVEIVGWSGMRSEIELVWFFIRTSPKLQRLSLDPTPPHQTETLWSEVIFSPVKRSDNELECAALSAQELIGCLHNKLAK